MPNHPTTPEVTLLVPAYREAAGLATLFARVGEVLEGEVDGYEIIVVDDGSPDDTFVQVLAAHQQDARIKGLRLSRNFGKEAALYAGLCHATGRAVITLDADLQHPPELIPKLLSAWRDGADIVHAVKQDRAVDGLSRRLIASSFNRLFTRLAGVDLNDSSDFKLLDRRVARILRERFNEHDRFYRGLAAWVGFEQCSVPFTVAERHAGISRWSRFGLIAYAMRMLTAFSSLPLQLVPAMGLLMFLMALLLGSEALLSRLGGEAVSGFATLEISILFTGSLTMFGLGIIGHYLARIFDELKRRPHYLVAASVGLESEERGNQAPPSTD